VEKGKDGKKDGKSAGSDFWRMSKGTSRAWDRLPQGEKIEKGGTSRSEKEFDRKIPLDSRRYSAEKGFFGGGFFRGIR